MASFIRELDNATDKRKRDGGGSEERDIQREQEIQMKIVAASQYNGTAPQPIFSPSPFGARPIISPRQRTPGSNHKRRFLLSPKETSTFSGSSTYNANPFTALHASLDPFTNASPLYTRTQQRPPSFNLPYTINSLAENIRVINQQISQDQTSTRRPSLDAVQAQQRMQKINLSACHICRRRPTQKKDLNSYADCEGCGKRCCWICVRQCLGGTQFWDTPQNEMEDFEMGDAEEHKEAEDQEGASLTVGWPAQGGHKAMICSACCVERGADGEVRCLACLKAEEAG